MKLNDYFDAYDNIHALAAAEPDWRTLRKKVRRSLARPTLELTGKTMARRLESALQELSFEHRSVIALSGLEGLSPEEVAAALGIPVGTVHSRLSRARAKLKGLLGAG